MDPILLAWRLPRFADTALRGSIVAALVAGSRPTQQNLVTDALIRFERIVQAQASDGVRPALLFAQRDRISASLRRFLASRFARRLFALRRREIIAVGRSARPFDALVRGRRGATYAVLIRTLPTGARRLDAYRAIRTAAGARPGRAPTGVVIYDLTDGCAMTLALAAQGAACAA